jgi:molybdenum cofactor cytidylyltransferase
MIFGQTPVRDAIGHILAHSIALGRTRLRKGCILNADDIGQLQKHNITQVVTAQLDADDIHEDDAATQFAHAICTDPVAAHVTLTPAHTGRVNIIAKCAGVVRLDADRLIQANSVNPMISVATVPPYQQMAAGGLIATVKIISYAVPKSDLAQAMDLAQSSVSLLPVQLKTACLICAHTGPKPDEGGADAIAARCDALGITVEQVRHCPHDTGALANTLASVTSDLILILTGSATSDENDTAPAALRQAGGDVVRFGMPVDPGNLLFYGNLGDRPVIGLPGCARSIALNGADWVLSRVVCGCSPNDGDFAQMAIGGLLKEIPTRPQPRHRARNMYNQSKKTGNP